MSDPTLDALTDAYEQQLVELLPEGPAWDGFRAADGRGRKLLRSKASLWAKLHARFDALMAEALPWRARETLATREAEAGLPDICTAGRATTIPERQAAVGAKWLGCSIGHRVSDFEGLAASLGYSATVTAGVPFRCGVSRCGGDELNPRAAAFALRVVVHGPRKTRFRCGVSQVGVDPLLKIQAAQDLECMIRRRAHSHVDVIFVYEE
ncbi:putative phage tail protein [Magnetospirillum fulvum]|uniref:Tail protein n=1 Tax=Magnetospirillum fulvum MGU-K5 TaxID=1316936 RepID=S9TGF9_MAGFU|nr:putative phage tail protein [Magnetospirillum fulvum]EPY01371.1 tail protein [Magnetospirillum fulvum MGU-K5]